MQTLTLKEAAAFLKMTPEGLRKKVIKGQIPGAKVGKYWLFILLDLVEYLRSRYSSNAETLQGVAEKERSKTQWHSTKEVMYGGLSSVTVEKEYSKLLAQQTRRQRSNIMTK